LRRRVSLLLSQRSLRRAGRRGGIGDVRAVALSRRRWRRYACRPRRARWSGV